MSKQQEYPKCPNKNEGKLVCLNDKCTIYPFFCTNCEQQKCQGPHHHTDKLTSIGFKQYIKKVLAQKKPPKQLQDAIQKYRKGLDKLRNDVEQFVKKQQDQLNEIIRKITQVEQSEAIIIKKLREKQYETLKGLQLDKLWYSAMKNETPKGINEILQFLSGKQEEIKVISQNFQIINQMQIGMVTTDIAGKSESKANKNSNQKNKSTKNKQESDNEMAGNMQMNEHDQ